MRRTAISVRVSRLSVSCDYDATHMFRVNFECCEHSNDDYKTMKNVLNYDSDTKLCKENEKDYIENFKKTLKFYGKAYMTKLPFIEKPEDLPDNY